MSQASKSASGGIGFGGMLAILFIGLKLCRVIDWSWWWVLCPLWIPFGIVIVAVVFCLAMAGLVALLDWKDSSRARVRRVKP